MKYTTIALPDNFEKGDCDFCPFCYEEYIGGEDGVIWHCVFGNHYNQCPVEVGEVVHIEDNVYKAESEDEE